MKRRFVAAPHQLQNPRCPGDSLSRTFGLPALHPCRPAPLESERLQTQMFPAQSILGTGRFQGLRAALSSPELANTRWESKAHLLLYSWGRKGSLPAANCPNHQDASLFSRCLPVFPSPEPYQHLAASWPARMPQSKVPDQHKCAAFKCIPALQNGVTSSP